MISITKVRLSEFSLILSQANFPKGEGHFEDQSAKASGAATPVETSDVTGKKGARGGKGTSKKAKTREQRLQMIDAEGDMGLLG